MLESIYYFIDITYLLLLIFALKKDLRSIINQYFIVFFVGLFLWQVTLHLYFYVNLGHYLLFIGRLNYAAGVLFSIGIFGFFHYFPVQGFKMPKWIEYLLWIVSLGLIIITMVTPLIDKMETPTDSGPVVTLGDWYNFYLVFVFGLPCVILIMGAIKNFRLKGLERLRYEYSFWVFVPSMIGFLISNVVLPIFGYIDQFLWSPLLLFPIALSSFYVIAKYRFLDIRLILARAIAFLFFILLCAGLYAFLLFYIGRQILGLQINLFTTGSTLFLAILAAITFQPILRWLSRITNKIFYKGHYESQKLLSELTTIMAQTIELNDMTTSILELLNKEMRLTKSAFLIIKNNKIEDIINVNYKKKDLVLKTLQEYFSKFLKSQPYIFEEMAEGQEKEFFRKFDIEVSIPIQVDKVNVAVLILGPKLSGEIYSAQDIDLLNIFASQAGIAIQNAESYEEIKKFNVELEKRVEERTHELKESQERELGKARDIAKLKDEFVFIASHELRTPVTAIRGFLELVKDASQNLPPDVRENFGYMSAASEHLNQLINDLLEISRSEAGTMKIAVQPMNVVPVIEAIVQELSPQANAHKIKVNLDIHPKTGLVMIDDKKTKEVLMNLLSNAVKYNRDEGKIDISVYPFDKQVMVEIKDTGYGIPENQQAKIFEKFFRATNEKTGDVLGTGLGLFITRMLVEKMGGKIMFSSIEGKGSTFAVLLPGAPGPTVKTPERASKTQAALKTDASPVLKN